jgi:hypothetical protein
MDRPSPPPLILAKAGADIATLDFARRSRHHRPSYCIDTIERALAQGCREWGRWPVSGS